MNTIHDNELWERLIAAEDRSKSNMHRLNTIEQEHGELNRNLNRMAIAVEVLATEQRNAGNEQRRLGETMKETADRVAGLELAPAKSASRLRDEIVRQVIGVIAGLLIGALASLLLQ